MSLEPVESNEHSIRFKVLQEVPLTAVVEHILSNADGALPPDVPAAGRARALELLQIGAVYVGFPQKGIDHINWVRSSDLPVAVTAASVASGQYVRVHPHPKRYPACYCKDWPSRVLFCDSDFVVVNKPAGLPCMRHESNAVEVLAECVGRALGMEGLEACHRLDQWTTGVVVLSRNKEANKAFKRALQDREAGLVKTYKALTAGPVPLGPLEHHMYDGPFNEGVAVLGGGNLRPRGPRLLSRTAHERWRACRLVVRECREHRGALAWHRRHLSQPSAGSGSNPHHSDQQQQQQQQQQPGTGPAPQQHPECGCGGDAAGGGGGQPTEEQQQQERQKQRDPVSGGDDVSADATPLEGRGGGGGGGEAGSDLASSSAAAGDGCGAGQGQPVRLYESTIELHTGRTHQIRAQLAAVGCPLVGDIMYTPITGYLVGESGVVEDPTMVALVEQLPMLDRHIGLHAWRLTWRGQVFEAPPDWGPE